MARTKDAARGACGALVALLTAGIVATGLVTAPPAGAAVTLTDMRQSAGWSGSIANTIVPDPRLCDLGTCRSFEVRVALPEDTWSTPGGMLVTLRWPDEQLDLWYDLDLYVYGPDGKLAGRSNNVNYSTAEGVWIQDPPNGRYRVVVAPRAEIGVSPFQVHVDFKRGWTVHTKQTSLLADSSGGGMLPFTPDFVFRGRRPRAVMQLLPDLVPDTPRNFHIESALGVTFYQSVDRGVRHQPSCYPQETLGATADHPGEEKSGARRCLRFDQSLTNLGRGPFELRAYPDEGDGTEAWQAVYGTDGSYTLRKAGQAVFSNLHGHVHFDGFDETGLYTINPDGSAGTLVKAMPDKGRCAIDTTNTRFGQPDNGPPHYPFPSTCDASINSDPTDPLYPNAMYHRSAISPGWGDLYPWFIPDAYIDISDVPDGRYLVVYRINRARNVLESDSTNNVSTACVEFHDTAANECPVVKSARSVKPKKKTRHTKRKQARRKHRSSRPRARR